MNLSDILNVHLGKIAMLILLVYIVTGWSLTGTFGLNRVIDQGTAHWIHYSLPLAILLVIVALLHGAGKLIIRLRASQAGK